MSKVWLNTAKDEMAPAQRSTRCAPKTFKGQDLSTGLSLLQDMRLLLEDMYGVVVER